MIATIQWSLTVLVHVDTQTLVEAACLALVASSSVDETPAVRLADVLHVTAHGTLEESPAAVTARHTVVLTRRTVTAHQATSTT